jgi:hypothetical protein
MSTIRMIVAWIRRRTPLRYLMLSVDKHIYFKHSKDDSSAKSIRIPLRYLTLSVDLHILNEHSKCESSLKSILKSTPSL